MNDSDPPFIPDEPRPTYRLILEALPDPDGPSAARRLAVILKHVLRGYGFRCLEATELRPAPPPEQTDASASLDVPEERGE